MSDNNNQSQIDDSMDSTPKWNVNDISGEALWNNDDDNFTDQNASVPNSNGAKANNPTVLNVADVTEDFPTISGQNSTTTFAVEDNQTNSISENTNAIAQPQAQPNHQNPQEVEIAAFTPEEANNPDNNQLQQEQEGESVLPTKRDDASLKNQIKNSVSSEGKYSLRVVVTGLVIIILAVTYLAAKSSDPKVVETKTASNKPLPVKDLKSELKSSFSSPDMGTCPESVTIARDKEPTPIPVETPPPVIINTPPEPPPIQMPIASEPIVIEKEVEKPKQLAFRMRAGDETVKSYEQSLKPVIAKEVATNTVKITIPRGTIIPLMMMQPFRNDIPTTVKCQIVSDVKTSKGELLIPAGSVAFVPFSPFRNDKRVFNQVDRPATINISEDQEIQLSGNATDKSGGIGIQGKLVKRGDAGIGKRLGRTMARVLTFGAAGAAGGVGGAVIAEAGSSAIEGSYVYTAPTDSYVEVPLGTIFFFNVTSNINNK